MELAGGATFVPRMIAQREPGQIVNTASMAGLTSRSGLVGLSETLAKDLRPHGLDVSVLCPKA